VIRLTLSRHEMMLVHSVLGKVPDENGATAALYYELMDRGWIDFIVSMKVATEYIHPMEYSSNYHRLMEESRETYVRRT
jgi:hypothetical protein